MQQEALFFERIEDALSAVIDACGGRKRFSALLMPDKPMRDAHNLLDAMLNPERRERFTPSQLVFVAKAGREAGCHAVMQFLAREAGYAEPVPADPEDQNAELQRSFIDAVAKLEGIQKQLQRVQQSRRRP
jgi:hypothetical protein